jgi:hypothetical protein
MKRLLKRRPSAGVVIGFLALAVALGGGAVAATKKKPQTKIEYKGLSKDARVKVLPISATNAGTGCDPTSTTFTTCTSVSLKLSSAFPRRVMLVFDGTFDSAAAASQARGDCRLQVDSQPVNGTTIHVEPTHHAPVAPATTTESGDGYGINIVTTPQGGSHTYSVACNETSPGPADLKVKQFQLSAVTVR